MLAAPSLPLPLLLAPPSCCSLACVLVVLVVFLIKSLIALRCAVSRASFFLPTARPPLNTGATPRPPRRRMLRRSCTTCPRLRDDSTAGAPLALRCAPQRCLEVLGCRSVLSQNRCGSICTRMRMKRDCCPRLRRHRRPNAQAHKEHVLHRNMSIWAVGQVAYSTGHAKLRQKMCFELIWRADLAELGKVPAPSQGGQTNELRRSEP